LCPSHLPRGDFQEIANYAKTFIQEESLDEELEHGFYIYDLGELKRTYELWTTLFPGIQPYYAVKCNPDEGLLRELASFGANFDCASPAEIQLVLNQGVSAHRILYANPCKSAWDLKYAHQKQIQRTTFDTVCELEKIAKYAPRMECILRLYACDPNAQCPLSNKFGAHEKEWSQLLQKASSLNLSVTGMSFHVGSGSSSAESFVHAIEQAHRLHKLGTTYGFQMNLLDIGGGFMKNNLSTIPSSIQKALETYGFHESPFQVIAEPGRFFAESCGSLFTKVLGIRDRSSTHRDYWISDSLYGSFNCILYDHIHPEPFILYNNEVVPPKTPDLLDWDAPVSPVVSVDSSDSDHDSVISVPTTSKNETYISTLFGPTCDGMDVVLKDIELPRLELNDWVAFPNMGAYTIAGACLFNGLGFPFIPKYYVRSQE
jgi:ornithine decarboxylase